MELLEQLIATAIVTTATYSFVAAGFGLIFAVSRIFHFAHAILFILEGYIAAALEPAIGLVPAIILGILTGAAGALLVELLVYQPMKRRSATAFTLLTASLGLMIGGQGVLGAIFGTERVDITNPLAGGHVGVLSADFTYLDLALIALALTLIPAFFIWVRRSRQGRGMLAVAEDPDVAVSVGVSSRKVRAIALVVGTVMSAPAALYLGMRSGLTPDEGLLPLLFAFAGVVVGGIGRMEGSVLGVAILVFVSTLSSYFIANYWTLAVAFVVLIGFLVWKPTGLLGRSRRATAL